jgi:hypothetical protein
LGRAPVPPRSLSPDQPSILSISLDHTQSPARRIGRVARLLAIDETVLTFVLVGFVSLKD